MADAAQFATKASSQATVTLRHPPYSYIHLELQSQLHQVPRGHDQKSATTMDEITLRQYLNLALTQYLGLTGSAIPIDVLKVNARKAWIRLPYEDEEGLVAALSQWKGKEISLRVKGRASWLGALVNDNEETDTIWSMKP